MTLKSSDQNKSNLSRPSLASRVVMGVVIASFVAWNCWRYPQVTAMFTAPTGTESNATVPADPADQTPQTENLDQAVNLSENLTDPLPADDLPRTDDTPVVDRIEPIDSKTQSAQSETVDEEVSVMEERIVSEEFAEEAAHPRPIAATPQPIAATLRPIAVTLRQITVIPRQEPVSFNSPTDVETPQIEEEGSTSADVEGIIVHDDSTAHSEISLQDDSAGPDGVDNPPDGRPQTRRLVPVGRLPFSDIYDEPIWAETSGRIGSNRMVVRRLPPVDRSPPISGLAMPDGSIPLYPETSYSLPYTWSQ